MSACVHTCTCTHVHPRVLAPCTYMCHDCTRVCLHAYLSACACLQHVLSHCGCSGALLCAPSAALEGEWLREADLPARGAGPGLPPLPPPLPNPRFLATALPPGLFWELKLFIEHDYELEL